MDDSVWCRFKEIPVRWINSPPANVLVIRGSFRMSRPDEGKDIHLKGNADIILL
jgi:hypothetical protein